MASNNNQAKFSKKPIKKYYSREWISTRLKTSKAAQQDDQRIKGLTTWLDILAKSVVVISALLYIVGRNYAEGYYKTIGLPVSNLPLSVQEYLFMSTRSFSFMKKIFGTSFISFLISILIPLLEGQIKKVIKSKSKSEKVELSSTKSDRLVFPDDSLLGKAWELFRANFIYAVISFLVLGFFILIPSARTSGSLDATDAMELAPFGEVLLSQPSIPEYVSNNISASPSTQIYRYSNLQIIGTLGNQWLLRISDSSGKPTVLSVPDSQIISIRYIGNPTPTTAPQPTVTSSPTFVVTATSSTLPTGTP